MAAVNRTRVPWLAALLAAALSGALALPQPDLRPVMPEVDGVHPLRALQALGTAFEPGGGFLDKYPPLGSFLFGLAVAAGDDGALARAVGPVLAAPEPERRVLLWELRDAVQAALSRERGLSRLAMAGCAALVVLLAAQLAREALQRSAWALAGPLAAGALFAAGPVACVYAGTANVDALALLPALGCVLLALQGRWVATGAALALAVALKDPQVALVPVLLGAAASRGGRPALLRAGAAAAATYAVASGAATGPAIWLEHVRYLTRGGVEGVGGIDHGDAAAWGRLLAHVGWLLWVAVGGSVLLVAVWRRPAPAGGRADQALVLAAALAPIPLFILPVGFAYARFLLPTVALLLACLGGALARAIAGFPGLARAGSIAAAWACALLALVLVLALTLPRPAPGSGPERDARRAVVARLDALAPGGGSVLLFADEREHGPPLDPSRWRVEVAGLNEVAPRLAALRDGPPDARPDHVLVMSFPTDPPSGASRDDPPPPQPGDRLAGLYVVTEVLRAPRDGLTRAVAWRPDLTLLSRAD